MAGTAGMIWPVVRQLYDVDRAERRAAMRAFRRVPFRERRVVIREANHGRWHPDPAVAAVAEQWARAVLARRWWNRVPGWLQPLACLALIVVGSWAGASVVAVPGGLLALVFGLLAWQTRAAAEVILRAAGHRPDEDAG